MKPFDLDRDGFAFKIFVRMDPFNDLISRSRPIISPLNI